MRCFVGSFFVLLTLASPAWAANLRIVGCDAVWSSVADPSPVYYVLIVNEQGAADRLAAWQLHLTIIPTEDATGVVRFASADLPRDSYEDYLLAGDSGILDVPNPPPGPLIVGPTDTVLLGDFARSVYGGTVSSSEKRLLKADFSASEDAQGIFAIAVVPGPENSFWASWDTNDFPEMTRGFANVPFEDEPVIIGEIAVGILVPEPHGILLLLGGAMLGFACHLCRYRTKRCG